MGIRLLNSWFDAYAYAPDVKDPTLTGVPFNDAYRYMDWLLTVPLLLIEILSMSFFLYIVYELLVGLSEATNSEADPLVRGKISTAQVMTVISWCTYPAVYLFPMMGTNASSAVVSVQLGYCVSDIISKCGVGLVIYQISY